MLVGAFEHTIDDKNRLTLPARFRESFAEGIVLTRGMDGCVYAYTRAEWDRQAGEFAALDSLDPDGRMLKRFFFASAADDQPDRQGRITLPQALLRHAQLDRDVVVAGVYDHLEIWNRATWSEQLQSMEGSAEDVAQRIAAARD